MPIFNPLAGGLVLGLVLILGVITHAFFEYFYRRTEGGIIFWGMLYAVSGIYGIAAHLILKWLCL